MLCFLQIFNHSAAYWMGDADADSLQVINNHVLFVVVFLFAAVVCVLFLYLSYFLLTEKKKDTR